MTKSDLVAKINEIANRISDLEIDLSSCHDQIMDIDRRVEELPTGESEIEDDDIEDGGR